MSRPAIVDAKGPNPIPPVRVVGNVVAPGKGEQLGPQSGKAK